MALVKIQIALFTRSYDLDQNALRDLRAKIDELNAGGSQFQIQDIPFFDAKEVPKFVARDGSFEVVFSSMKFDFFWTAESISIETYPTVANNLVNRARSILDFSGAPSLFSRIGFIRTSVFEESNESYLPSRIFSSVIQESLPTGIRINYTVTDVVDSQPCNRVITLQSAKLLTTNTPAIVLEEDLNTKQENDLSSDTETVFQILQNMINHHPVNELAEGILSYVEPRQGS